MATTPLEKYVRSQTPVLPQSQTRYFLDELRKIEVTLKTNHEALTALSVIEVDNGNIGFGVTPSAWGGGQNALELNNGSLSVSTSGPYINQNAVFTTNWVYKANGAAAQYQQVSGEHRWFTAASGTAGGAITFSRPLTLDANGNLLIGLSAATGHRLVVNGTMRSMAQGDRNVLSFQIDATNGNPAWTQQNLIGHYSTGTQDAVSIRVPSSTASNTGSYDILSNGTHIWYAAGASNSTGSTATELARITSTGELLVKKTAIGVGTVGFAAADYIEVTRDSNPVAYFTRLTTDGDAVQFRRSSGAAIGSISVTATATAYNTSSDYRLKEDVQPMTGALAKVSALKPCTYRWKSNGTAGEGFIAHELAEVVPQAVTGTKDAVDDEGNPVYQAIDTSFLVATLTAAIQEQQKIITDLRARIEVLESK